MPHISYKRKKGWSNYHLTVSNDIDEYGTLKDIEDGNCDGSSGLSGPKRFLSTREPLHKFIAKALHQKTAAGMLGTAWSFSDLVGNHNLELDLRGLTGCSISKAKELHRSCKLDPQEIAYVSGGTTLRCLAEWAAKLTPKMSIKTSGTHLGPTIAGGFGTASHGSRLGFGGLQDMILGLHIVVSERESVWIEPEREDVFSDTTALRFATRVIRSDAIFDHALIHLGGMGIVNGVALRLIPYRVYNVLPVVKPLWPEWADQVEAGQFDKIAAHLGHPHEPCFYEATIDPFDNAGERKAIHLMYFEAAAGALPPDGGTQIPAVHASDAISLMVQAILTQLETQDSATLASLVPQDFTAFDFYRGIFEKVYSVFPVPIKPGAPTRGWERLHTDEITGNLPGALYNASYAVPREKAGDALDAILQAAVGLQPSFIYTFRFVTKRAGTLAFTRFAENAVIEIDGVSDKAPTEVRDLGESTKAGAMNIRTAFRNANIEFSMHWAKLGQLDQPKVERDFGPSAHPHSPIAQWRATRSKLLPKHILPLFVNDAIQNYGLV